MTMTLNAVGHVRVEGGRWFVEIAPEVRAGHRGLEGFGHVQVLFWCHNVDTPELREMLECEKP